MGRIVLVTGANRGIGLAILEYFVIRNYRVIGTATTADGAQAISANIKGLGGVGHGMVLDVGIESNVNEVFENIVKVHGTPEILVNNAGITRDNLFMRMPAEDFAKVIQTNLVGAFYLSKLNIRAMLRAKFGRIINISSVVAYMGNAGQGNYCAAKAGLIGLTKSLAREVASRNITVNLVAPGYINTDMTNKLTPQQQEMLLQHIPMQRMGLAKEVAAAVAFLASEDASYITGQAIHVNGGLCMV